MCWPGSEWLTNVIIAIVQHTTASEQKQQKRLDHCFSFNCWKYLKNSGGWVAQGFSPLSPSSPRLYITSWSIHCALAKSDALVPSQGEQTLYRVGLLNTVRNSLYKPQRPDLHPESKFRVFKPSKCASFYKVYCAVGLLQNKWCSILAEEQTLVFCAWFMPPTFIMFHKHMSQVKRLKCLSGTANH